MRQVSFFAILLLVGCGSRVDLISSYEDEHGHRLCLFADSMFIVNAGNESENFYRRSRWAFGRYGVVSDSMLVLESAWPRSLTTSLFKDTLCTKGLCVRFVDIQGKTVLDAARCRLGGIDSSDFVWSDPYSLFYSEKWSGNIHVQDPRGMFNVSPVHLPDSSWHSCVVRFGMHFFEFDDQYILRGLALRRDTDILIPNAEALSRQREATLFGVFRRTELGQRDRKRLEERAFRLRRCGHPDLDCRQLGK